MTAIAVPGVAARSSRVPVRRVAWVTWRQHRGALAGAVALLGTLGAYLLYMGLSIHSAYATVAACHPSGSAKCQHLLQVFNQHYYGSQQGSVMTSGINAQSVPFLLLAVPILLGVFVGAPVLARELESGTFRFAWTQACGRVRWAVVRLGLVAVALTVLAYAFSQLFSWYFSPFLAEGQSSKFPMQLFGNLGVDFAAWTLLAFAVAAFLGVVIRRAVAAMAVALAACTVLDVVTMMALRQHYATPLVASGANPPGGSSIWLIGQWLTGPGGQRFNQANIPMSVQASPDPDAFTNWLRTAHISQWWSYVPGSDFWRFQFIEGGWLLGGSALLIAAAIWMVRRRAA
jgi:hypothetical protein